MECIKRMRIKNGMEMKTTFPCGKCMPCVMTRRAEWTCRLLLEMKTHLMTYYVTLTYSDLDMPYHGDLEKQDVQLFLKRLRKNTGIKLRYFLCGEYGDKKGRPHYHCLIYADREFSIKLGKTKTRKDVVKDSDFHKAWYSHSFVDVVPLVDAKSKRHVAGYVAGYVLKKLGDTTEGRVKEFILSSRRPGLGEEYAKIIARRLKNVNVGLPGTDGVSFWKDLFVIKIDGKTYPLGRYMREKIYAEYGGDIRPARIVTGKH